MYHLIICCLSICPAIDCYADCLVTKCLDAWPMIVDSSWKITNLSMSCKLFNSDSVASKCFIVFYEVIVSYFWATMDIYRDCVPFLGYFRCRICLEIWRLENYERLVCTKTDLSNLVKGFLFSFDITITTQLFPKLIYLLMFMEAIKHPLVLTSKNR